MGSIGVVETSTEVIGTNAAELVGPSAAEVFGPSAAEVVVISAGQVHVEVVVIAAEVVVGNIEADVVTWLRAAAAEVCYVCGVNYWI